MVLEGSVHHAFQCKSTQATKTHKKVVKTSKEGPRKAQTAPIIQRVIIQCIEKHRKGYKNLTFKDSIVPNEEKELAAKVFHKQDRLGVTALLQGYVSKDWAII